MKKAPKNETDGLLMGREKIQARLYTIQTF